MKNGITYFQCPIGMWDTEPYATARRELGPNVISCFYLAAEAIRKGGGRDTLDHILTLFDDTRNKREREACKRRMLRMLSSRYNLFTVTSQRMVFMAGHQKDVIAKNKEALTGPFLFDPDNVQGL